MKPPESLQRIQNHNFRLLKFLNEACQKCGATLLASGGTMLGCMRHEGFIPWDDDADTYMFKSDIEKLDEWLAENSDEYYVMTNWYHGHFYKLKSIHYPRLFIDIFPFQTLLIYEDRSVVTDEMVTSDDLKGHEKPLKIIYRPTRDNQRFTRWMEYWEEKQLFPLVEKRFEGIALKCPNDADGILRSFYGRYMDVPRGDHMHRNNEKVSEAIEKIDSTGFTTGQLNKIYADIAHDYLFEYRRQIKKEEKSYRKCAKWLAKSDFSDGDYSVLESFVAKCDKDDLPLLTVALMEEFKNDEKARRTLECAQYGRLADDLLAQSRPAEAAQALRKACRIDPSYGKRLFDVLSESEDESLRSEALLAVRPLAEAGDRGARRRVAKAYRRGIGVRKDPREAKRWLRPERAPQGSR